MSSVEFAYIGKHWPYSGDLFFMAHLNGHQARVYVDDLGETWVDIRRVPEGGYFHTERVEAWRAVGGAAEAERILHDRGFVAKRVAPYANRVRERGV